MVEFLIGYAFSWGMARTTKDEPIVSCGIEVTWRVGIWSNKNA